MFYFCLVPVILQIFCNPVNKNLVVDCCLRYVLYAIFILLRSLGYSTVIYEDLSVLLHYFPLLCPLSRVVLLAYQISFFVVLPD